MGLWDKKQIEGFVNISACHLIAVRGDDNRWAPSPDAPELFPLLPANLDKHRVTQEQFDDMFKNTKVFIYC